MRLLSLFVAGLLALAAPSALAQERAIESCAATSKFKAAPSRVITLNQQATEIMLALGLEVKDDGSGLAEVSPDHDGMGMNIMHYRARDIGGELTITNSPDGGTVVRCSVPLADSNQAS